MAETPADNNPKGPLRALYDWLKGPTPPSQQSERSATGAARQDVRPSRLGHYAIERKLGEGGMGVVYAARDEKLDRTVALKTMSSLAEDETARKRFWREARAAASVNHVHGPAARHAQHAVESRAMTATIGGEGFVTAIMTVARAF